MVRTASHPGWSVRAMRRLTQLSPSTSMTTALGLCAEAAVLPSARGLLRSVVSGSVPHALPASLERVLESLDLGSVLGRPTGRNG
jgi:hypothetical protein